MSTNKVKQCIENATLAPNSSNMQLWEFIHVTDKKILKKIAYACFNQNAAKTSKNMVVFVARRDRWRSRAKENLNFLENLFDKQEKEGVDVKKRRNLSRRYYKKIMPTIYSDFFGLLGIYKNFYPMLVCSDLYTEKDLYSDLKVVTHKSVASAAQNFMLSTDEIGYDTCPMEGVIQVGKKNIKSTKS